MSVLRATPILCYITDRRSLPFAQSGDSTKAVLAKIASLAQAGVDWIQIREKDLSGRAVTGLLRESLARVAQQSSHSRRKTRIVVNDRLDIAVVEGAGGVHLGENSLGVAETERLLQTMSSAPSRGNDFLIGVSTHSLGAAKAAAAAKADYIIFGPVFATPSKAQYGDPPGLAGLEEVCAAVNIPVIAIGGITLENAAMCCEAGAAGIAAIRLFQDAADSQETVLRLREALRGTSPGSS